MNSAARYDELMRRAAAATQLKAERLPESMRYGYLGQHSPGTLHMHKTPPGSYRSPATSTKTFSPVGTPSRLPGGGDGTYSSYVQMSQAEYQQLLKQAVRADGAETSEPASLPPPSTYTADVTKLIEVPHVEQVQTKVMGYTVEPALEKKTVSVKKMVPVERTREVEESAVEIQEEMVTGTRLVWKQVPEEYEYVVKKPVVVTKKKSVPYTDYEERMVDVSVDVPVERKVRSQRLDITAAATYVHMRPCLAPVQDIS